MKGDCHIVAKYYFLKCLTLYSILFYFVFYREGPMQDDAEQHRKPQMEPEDHLCVVCQDSERCTIILPCRHVCLCYECCVTIKRTHGRCPICRHIVRRTMRVFI